LLDQTSEDSTAAVPTTAPPETPPGATEGAAICSLSIVGFGDSDEGEGIKSASVSCRGGTITAAAHQVLRDFWGPKIKAMRGVTWSDVQKLERDDCLLTVCGQSDTVFNGAVINGLKGGAGEPAWRIALCIAERSSITFNNCSFTSNKEATPLVVLNTGTAVLLDQCLIQGNVVKEQVNGYAYTSGVGVMRARLNIRSSTIAHNTGSEGGYAGAVSATDTSHVSIHNTLFHNNVGGYGAAIEVQDQSRVVIRGSHFVGNTASHEGGAVYTTGQAEVRITAGDQSSGMATYAHRQL
jgi:predicted outer membrane repeat protein